MRLPIGFRNILAALLLALVMAAVVRADDDSVLRAEIPATDLERILIDADVGQVSVKGADTEAISVVVTLDNKGWGSGPHEEWLNESSLAQKKSRSELRLSVKLPRGADKDDLEEEWVVTVPRSFGARVRIGVGTVDIIDVSGGVDARAGVGEITIEVPGGDVEAHSSVGDVEVISGTPDYGHIELDSNVGAVRLRLRGERVKARHGWGPGQSLSVEGDGKDHVDASANVGSVRVVIE